MTQDQYGQARVPGYVVRGDVADDENGERPEEEDRPMTRFQKVASALRGDKPDPDEADQADAPQAADQDVPPAGTGAGRKDYWDVEADAERDQVTAVTSPDGPDTDPDLARQDEDHAATQPDMFGTAARTGNGNAPAEASQDQAAEATIPDAAPAEAPVAAPAGAPAAASTEMRPGEAAGRLGDFSDLTYGDLIPDAQSYSAQWQQIQFRFVDDPQGSVTEAADVISQVTAKLEAAIQERQRAIEERQRAIAEQQRSLRGRWGEGTNADTETLRETLRMYRTFLNQLIGPRAS